MAHISFTSNLQKHVSVDSLEVISGSGDSLAQVFTQVFVQYPALKTYLVDDQFRLRQHVAVFVDHTLVREKDLTKVHCAVHADIFVAQALSGG